jgi:hypothetical protein
VTGIGGLALDVSLQCEEERATDRERHGLEVVDSRFASTALGARDDHPTDSRSIRHLLLGEPAGTSSRADLPPDARQLLVRPPLRVDREVRPPDPRHDRLMFIAAVLLRISGPAPPITRDVRVGLNRRREGAPVTR